MGFRRRVSLGLVLGLVWAGCAGIVPASAATQYTVMAGGESSDLGAQVNVFAPSTVTVSLGDTITWKLGSTEFHTVTFLAGTPRPDFVSVTSSGPAFNPAVVNPAGGPNFDGQGMRNSGLMQKGQIEEYNLTFLFPGTYDYVCAIHENMTGQVVVKVRDAKGDDPAAVQAAAAPQINTALAAKALPLALQYANEKVTGEIATGVTAGAGDKTVALMRFLPGNLVIHNGDTVTWTNEDPETPHTVSFLQGNALPGVVLPVNQASGPPLLVMNPVVLLPHGGDTFDGSDSANSGVFGGTFPGPKSYTLKFTKVGVYDYICELHPEMGMKGTVVVLPRT